MKICMNDFWAKNELILGYPSNIFRSKIEAKYYLDRFYRVFFQESITPLIIMISKK
jgi:hypothetical protein